MDRVVVSGAGFVAGGRPFHPVGPNYIQLGPNSAGALYHNLFDPGCYDAQRVDADLHAIGSADPVNGWGFAVVRVFATTNLYCSAMGMNAPGVDPTWLGNLADFIARAATQNVRVYLTGTSTPPANYWGLAGAIPAGLDPASANTPILYSGYAAASGQFWHDVLNGLAARDPTLLDAIFAIDLANEIAVRTDQAPFSATSGTVTCCGKGYDMGSAPSRDALVLDACTAWADTVASAVRLTAPGVLVTASVYSPAAIGGLTYPAGVISPTGWYPMQAGWLEAHSTLDFVDAHAYFGPPVNRALAVSGLPRQRAKPLILGETGVQKSQAQSPAGAGWLLQRLIGNAVSGYGATGYLPWSWSTAEDDGDPTQALFYSFVDEDFAIAAALTPDNWSAFA